MTTDTPTHAVKLARLAIDYAYLAENSWAENGLDDRIAHALASIATSLGAIVAHLIDTEQDDTAPARETIV